MFELLSNQIFDAFKSLKGEGKISEKNIEETVDQVKKALLEADVNIQVVKAFVEQVKNKAIGQKVYRKAKPKEQFVKILHDELLTVMGPAGEQLKIKKPKTVILMVGLNGVGKTTFCAKLAKKLKNDGKTLLLVPADTQRPAAKDQLQILAKQIDVACFDSNLSLSPHAIVQKALQENNQEVIIVDTAGRFHVNEELMQELKEVKKSLKDIHHQTLLVADAMIGQESVQVAQSFNQAVGLDGVVLSKMDSDAKGGASLSIRFVTQVPILFSSFGEKLDDLDIFHPDRIVKRLLDMGDILTLIEKANVAIDESQTEKMIENIKNSRFTADDFLAQIETMNKMGSFSGLMKMIPGMGQMMKQLPDTSKMEDELKNMKVIIGSMTKKEKDNYKLIDESRKKRLARGSGKSLDEVNEFLKKFDQMAKMMGNVGSALKQGRLPNMEELLGIPGVGAPKGFRTLPKSAKSNKSGSKKGPFGKSFF